MQLRHDIENTSRCVVSADTHKHTHTQWHSLSWHNLEDEEGDQTTSPFSETK